MITVIQPGKQTIFPCNPDATFRCDCPQCGSIFVVTADEVVPTIRCFEKDEVQDFIARCPTENCRTVSAVYPEDFE